MAQLIAPQIGGDVSERRCQVSKGLTDGSHECGVVSTLAVVKKSMKDKTIGRVFKERK
jgi:hypothetical protein